MHTALLALLLALAQHDADDAAEPEIKITECQPVRILRTTGRVLEGYLLSLDSDKVVFALAGSARRMEIRADEIRMVQTRAHTYQYDRAKHHFDLVSPNSPTATRSPPSDAANLSHSDHGSTPELTELSSPSAASAAQDPVPDPLPRYIRIGSWAVTQAKSRSGSSSEVPSRTATASASAENPTDYPLQVTVNLRVLFEQEIVLFVDFRPIEVTQSYVLPPRSISTISVHCDSGCDIDYMVYPRQVSSVVVKNIAVQPLYRRTITDTTAR